MMVRVHGYNAERKEKGFGDLYIMAILFGALAVVVLVIGGKGLAFLISFFIDKWVWLVAVVLAIILIRKFMTRRRNR